MSPIEKKQAQLLQLRLRLDVMPKFVQDGESSSRNVPNPDRVPIQRRHDEILIEIQRALHSSSAPV